MPQETSVNWATHQPLVEIWGVWLRRHSQSAPLPRTAAEDAERVRRVRGAKLLRPNLYFLALSTLNISKPSAGLRFLCTTAWTALIIACGASDWKMLRPMSTPAAPCWTAL